MFFGAGSDRDIVKPRAVLGIKSHQPARLHQASGQGLGEGEIIRIVGGDHQVEALPAQPAEQAQIAQRPAHQVGLVIRPDPVDPAGGALPEQPGHRMVDQQMNLRAGQRGADRPQERQQQDPVPDALIEPEHQHLADRRRFRCAFLQRGQETQQDTLQGALESQLQPFGNRFIHSGVIHSCRAAFCGAHCGAAVE